MNPHHSRPTNLIAWALLSQTFWLPLVGIDLHDRYQARIRDLAPGRMDSSDRSPDGRVISGQPLPDPLTASLGTALRQSSTGLVLGTRGAGHGPALRTPLDSSGKDPGGPPAISNGISPRPFATETLQALRLERSSTPSASQTASPRNASRGKRHPQPASFRNSDLLGGALTLTDLRAPSMPPLAVAEQARLSSSDDPLAPLPSVWRAPMRAALRQLPLPPSGITSARVVHVPSTRVKRPTPVPLALQSDGSVDVLSSPDPEALKDIESWSRRQKPPQRGTVTPAVVNLQPLNPANAAHEVKAPAPAPRRVSPPTSTPATVQQASPLPATVKDGTPPSTSRSPVTSQVVERVPTTSQAPASSTSIPLSTPSQDSGSSSLPAAPISTP